jgi:integrase/recombinase XerD
MDTQIIPASLSRYEQSLLDMNPLASQIIPLLVTFQNRIKSAESWRVYKQDMKHFIGWLGEESILDPSDITLDDMYAYHAHLRAYRYGPDENKPYSNNTINRMFTVARRLLSIMAEKKLLINPCKDLDIDKMPVDDETSHVALDDDQAQRLLAQIDRSTKLGKRNYALVSLLIRTALRRNEAKMLNLGDIRMEQGHYIALIHYAKGGKPGRVKIPTDVWRDIQIYQESLGERRYNRLNAPLFVSFRRGDNLSLVEDERIGQLVEARIDVKAIETLVKDLGEAIGVPDLTPHGLRATAITLWLEHNATLEQAQYAARHKDPRMTERYRKRKFNLDNNAVDKLSFLAREE